MKKITLIAAAALAATTAIAGTPNVASIAQQHKAQMTPVSDVKMTASRAQSMGVKLNDPIIDKTADGEFEVSTPSVRYAATANSFYGGFSPALNYYNVINGFTGIRNKVGFRNLTQNATEFDWQYGEAVGYDEEAQEYIYDYTNSSETNLYMPLKPRAMYSFPTLSVPDGEDFISTSASQNGFYLCGRDAYSWGLNFVKTGATQVTWNDILGVSPCAAVPGADLFPDFCIERPGSKKYSAQSFNQNGTCLYWEWAYTEVLTDDKGNSILDENGNEIVTSEFANAEVKGFGTLFPEMPSSYQLGAMWCWFQTELAEGCGSVTLPVTVYGFDDEGHFDKNIVYGKGELNIPEGYTLAGAGAMTVVELSAVDEDGYEIDSPVCIETGTPVFVVIEGLDDPNLLSFELVANGSTTLPKTDAALGRYIWPQHAYGFIQADITDYVEDPENPGKYIVSEKYSDEYILGPGYYYTPNDDPTVFIRPSDFTMYFDVYFPEVINRDKESADYGTADFNYEVKQEGESFTVPVFCSYNIEKMMGDELMQCLSSSWLSVETVFDEEEQITNVTITAAANDGADRTGYVVYLGYACDFVITVNQKGDNSGIQAIDCQPVAKGTRFFDLQGRELTTQPASGIYFQTVDGRTTKHLAK